MGDETGWRGLQRIEQVQGWIESVEGGTGDARGSAAFKVVSK